MKDASIDYNKPVIGKKASSTSSLYIGSTIITPNINSILRGLAAFLFPRISTKPADLEPIMKHPKLYYFCEEKYIIENPEMTALSSVSPSPPTKESIATFIGALFDSAQFSPECCVVCIIYITRMLHLNPEVSLHSSNWRPLVLTSLIIAQKVVCRFTIGLG